MADMQPPTDPNPQAGVEPQQAPPAEHQPSIMEAVRKRYEVPEDVTEDEFFDQFDKGLKYQQEAEELRQQLALLQQKQQAAPQPEPTPAPEPKENVEPQEPTFEIDPEIRKIADIPKLSDYAQDMVSRGWVYQDPETKIWTAKEPHLAPFAEEVNKHYMARQNFSNKLFQNPWELIQKGAEPIVKQNAYELRKSIMDEISKMIEDKLGASQPSDPQQEITVMDLVAKEANENPAKFYAFENGQWKYGENGKPVMTPYSEAFNEHAKYLSEAGLQDPQKIFDAAKAYAERAVAAAKKPEPEPEPVQDSGDKKQNFLKRQRANGNAPVNRIQNLPGREVPEISTPTTNRKGRGIELYKEAIAKQQ